MIRKNFVLFTALFLALFILDCQKNTVPEIEIIARVGGEYLTRDELINWMPPNLPEDQKDIVIRQYIDRWIEKTTMALSAKADGLSLTKYEKWAIQNLEKEMLAQKYLTAKLPKEIIITDEEISTYYERNKDEFIRDEDEVHIVQLFLENLDRAISEEIRELKLLLKVIEKNYLDTQFNRLVEKNGDLGYVQVKNLRKEVIRLVKSGSTGRIYGPIRIESGYYYFQMLDKQKSGSYRSQDLVKDEIKLRLISVKREILAEEIADKMAVKFAVKIFPEHIK